MKTILLSTLIAILLACNAFSQQSTTDAGLPVFGLGMKITPFNWNDIFLADANFLIPGGADMISFVIDPTTHLRIEPELGVSISSFKSTSGNNTNTSTATGLRLGTLVGYMWQKGSTNFYAGPRFNYLLFSMTDEDDITGIMIGAAIGGEYFFSKHLSAGAEFHVSDFLLNDSNVFDEKISTISTDGAFTVRIFFK